MKWNTSLLEFDDCEMVGGGGESEYGALLEVIQQGLELEFKHSRGHGRIPRRLDLLPRWVTRDCNEKRGPPEPVSVRFGNFVI